MRNYSFPLAAALALLIACSSQAAEKPRPAQGNSNQPKKVWTNDDMDQLRSRGLISIVGQEATEPAAQAPAPAEPAETTFPIYESRLDDPEWYADRAADLQAELDKRQAALLQQQTAIAQAADQRITEPGLALDKDNAGVTPAAGLVNLEAQVQEVQSRLDELSDLARQHDIPPGVLRG
jgi:hypothetical protein